MTNLFTSNLVVFVAFLTLSSFIVLSQSKNSSNNSNTNLKPLAKFSNQMGISPKQILDELDSINFKGDDDDCDDIFKEKKESIVVVKDCKFANNCNNHGECKDGKCICFDGWTSYDCSISLCVNFCSGHGKCLGGKCLCDPGYSGEDCSIVTCPNECSHNGRCIVSNLYIKCFFYLFFYLLFALAWKMRLLSFSLGL